MCAPLCTVVQVFGHPLCEPLCAHRGVYIAGGRGFPAGSHRARYVGRVVEGVMGGIFSRNLQARFLHTRIN